MNLGDLCNAVKKILDRIPCLRTPNTAEILILLRYAISGQSSVHAGIEKAFTWFVPAGGLIVDEFFFNFSIYLYSI